MKLENGDSSEQYQSQIDDAASKEYQLKLMQGIENRIPKTVRKRTYNWILVQRYMLGFTSKGGSTSCCIHCLWLGVDPDGYTFFN